MRSSHLLADGEGDTYTVWARADGGLRVQVSTSDGQKLYGGGYRDMAYFVKKHLYGAADRECDHWHDDAGQHVATSRRLL